MQALMTVVQSLFCCVTKAAVDGKVIRMSNSVMDGRLVSDTERSTGRGRTGKSPFETESDEASVVGGDGGGDLADDEMAFAPNTIEWSAL